MSLASSRRETDLKPYLLICLSAHKLDDGTRKKHSLLCQVPPEWVFSLHDVSNLYSVQLLVAEQDVGCLMCDRLDLPDSGQVAHTLPSSDAAFQPGFLSCHLDDWRTIADRTDQGGDEVVVALVGKYKDRWPRKAASTARLRLASPSWRGRST